MKCICNPCSKENCSGFEAQCMACAHAWLHKDSDFEAYAKALDKVTDKIAPPSQLRDIKNDS